MISPSLEQKLENRVGSLAQVVPLFKLGTARTSAEITQERVAEQKAETKQRKRDRTLRDKLFYPNNFAMYTVEGGDSFLYLGGRTANLIFDNVQEASQQLVKTGNYTPNRESIDAVVASVNSGETVRVNVADLKLKKETAEYGYFEIDTTSYATLNDEQKKVAAVGYGSMEQRKVAGGETSDFDEAMAMLRSEGISTTRVYVLHPNCVNKNVKKDSAIARACWLDDTVNDSSFGANVRYVNYIGAVRGVPLAFAVENAAEGSEPKQAKPDYVGAIKLLVADPAAVVQHLSKENADALMGLVNLFYAKK